jgi:hypothetical protein
MDIFDPRQDQYQYLTLRYSYQGRGISGEFNFLDVDGERIITRGGVGDVETWGPTEAILYRKLGEAGWQLVGYGVAGESEGVGSTHYAKFIRRVR